MGKNQITEQEYKAVKRQMAKNKLKRVDKRLQVIALSYEGHPGKAIAEKLGFSQTWVSLLLKEFKQVGLEEYARHKYGGNNQSIETAKEEEILENFKQKAASGQMVTAAEIKKAFDEYRGKDTGRGYIYMLLERHNWRQIMPRSRHPKKASDEAIEASKKLTQNSES